MSSESVEAIFESVHIQQEMSGIKIREVVVPGPNADIPFSSNKKGKRVLEEEGEVYTRNIRAHKPNVPFVNLNQTDMAARFNKAARCLLSKGDIDYLDSLNPTERAQKA